MLTRKFRMRSLIIQTDADNLRIQSPELLPIVAERASFPGAAGCLILGIKIHHNPLPAIIA